MLNTADLVRDGRPSAEGVEAAIHEHADVAKLLAAGPADPALAAALALVAGIAKVPGTRDALLALLDRDDVAGTAAAWALAQLDSEAVLVAALAEGGLDLRTNAYLALAGLAARGAASGSLAAAMASRVEAENARARSKRTGLGEQACKILAILGAPSSAELIRSVLEADPFTDKFELERLRKAVTDGGRDRDSIAALNASWRIQFADHLAPQAVAAVPPAAVETTTPPPAAEEPRPEAVDPEAPPTEGDLPAPAPIDWKAFLISPEAEALGPKGKALAAQLAPLLEQLAVRAINAPLTDLSGQELAALLLQVLPQALPPQHVQVALSPDALHAYQAIAKYLARTGLATQGLDLVEGVRLVRKELTAQMRKSGMLGGPDYADPDEAKPIIS